MTYEEWKTPYALLCAARGWREDAKQCRAYFDALQDFGLDVVKAATLIARSRAWARTKAPTSSDLVELCRMEQRGRRVSASACDVCGGDQFTQHACDPEDADRSGGVRPCGVRHGRVQTMRTRDGGVIEQPYRHTFARRCPQCHPSVVRKAGAA